MRRILLLLIFNHSGYGLKHGEIKTWVWLFICAGFCSCWWACAWFCLCWSSATLDIQPKTWRNKNVSMLDMWRIFILLIFSNSGSGLKHGKIKNTSRYVVHAQDFFPVDLQPLGIRPKAWRNKNGSMLRMCRILLLLIFSHSDSGLKNDEKMRVCCAIRIWRIFLPLIMIRNPISRIRKKNLTQIPNPELKKHRKPDLDPQHYFLYA